MIFFLFFSCSSYNFSLENTISKKILVFWFIFLVVGFWKKFRSFFRLASLKKDFLHNFIYHFVKFKILYKSTLCFCSNKRLYIRYCFFLILKNFGRPILIIFKFYLKSKFINVKYVVKAFFRDFHKKYLTFFHIF
jgi:hypothetical protein